MGRARDDRPRNPALEAVEADLRERVRRQEAVAELGLLALEGGALQEFMDEIVSRVVGVLSLEYCKVLEFVPDDDALLVRSGVGWEDVAGRAAVGTNLDSHAGYALISDGPVVMDDAGDERRFTPTPLLRERGITSGVATAVHTGDHVYGVLAAHSEERRTFTAGDVRFVQDVADVLGTAVGRKLAEEGARLEIQERTRQARAAERRFRFLAEANALLSNTLDYTTVLVSAARLAVPAIADWCFVDVVEEGGTVHRVVVAHAEGAEEDMVEETRCHYPFDPCLPHGTSGVLRTGRPEIIPETGDAVVRELSRSPEQLRTLRRMGPRSYVGVPLRVRGEVIGAMGFVSARSGRRYGREDAALAEGLAHCTALAADNALHHVPELELARELIRLARRNRQTVSPPRKDAPELTGRQREVLRLLGAGKSAKEIHAELHLSEATVRNHIRSLLQALDAHSQLEALARARELGILSP